MRWLQLICMSALVAMALGCNASKKELGADDSSEGLKEPTPEDIMGSMPPEARKQYEQMGGVPDAKPPEGEPAK